ncbi:MAG: ABC transporter ATP-binding protein [Pseudomonadota bacterium]
MSNYLLSATELALGYHDTAIVRELSFELVPGTVLAVVGHNGSGKSTLIKTLLGNLAPLSGRLDWASGKPPSMAYLGQRTEFDNQFPLRVRDLAGMGAWSGLGLLNRIDTECRRRIDEAMERTGIAAIADMPIHHLSAGQLQRALFARSIVQDARLILLDEPFTAVDQTTEAELLGLIDDWADEGRSVIIVLHNLSAVLQHCNTALLLGNGEARFGTASETLTPENLVSHGYLSPSQVEWLEAMYAS